MRFDILDVLARPDADPSPATLMVLDFALSYSDDWFRADDARCLDDFRSHSRRGDGCVRRRHSRESAGWPLESVSTRYHREPAGALARLSGGRTAQAVEGLPLEEVHFLPDEVANVAWAIERVAPESLGRGRTLCEPPPAPPSNIPPDWSGR